MRLICLSFISNFHMVELVCGGSTEVEGFTWRNPVRVASPHRINLEEPGQGGQPT
jgi:hypothetical protein